MENFANDTPKLRDEAFQETAAQLGMSKAIIEKDFWVCWSLKQLFALPSFGKQLIFKGGTSLSKAYDVIDRFSEDVDLCVFRSIRPPIPTTCAHLFRGIRPPVTHCREAAYFGYQS